MGGNECTMTRPAVAISSLRAAAALPGLLRVGVALCFIGHGAFGLITKQAWLPFFAWAGIGESWAWRLMPWIGACDIAVGVLALAWPCRALFAWATAWAIWTALCRPLAGQGWSEFFERAGNYGVPLAILAIVGWHAPWFARLPHVWPELDAAIVRRRLEWTLRFTTACLLAGHAGCAVFARQAGLASHCALLFPEHTAGALAALGAIEFALALAVLVVPGPALLLGITVWKLATESLFLLSNVSAPLFEVIERGGSYVAPLALAFLLWRREPNSLPSPSTPTAATAA